MTKTLTCVSRERSLSGSGWCLRSAVPAGGELCRPPRCPAPGRAEHSVTMSRADARGARGGNGSRRPRGHRGEPRVWFIGCRGRDSSRPEVPARPAPPCPAPRTLPLQDACGGYRDRDVGDRTQGRGRSPQNSFGKSLNKQLVPHGAR